MTAWLEPLSAVIRVGGGGAKHGDDYHFAATIRYLEIDEVEVLGVDTTVTKSAWEAMIKCFRANGIKRVLFKRVKNGVSRDKWVEVK